MAIEHDKPETARPQDFKAAQKSHHKQCEKANFCLTT
jgi:hypothetical protein